MRKLSLISIVFMLLFVVACSNSASQNPQENSSGNGTSSDSNNQTDGSKSNSDYPNKPVKLVIPYPPGGATDVIFRLVAKEAEKHLGTTIVPTNMAGASSTVGSRYVKDAEPDGYTILGSHDVIATAYLTGVVDYSFEAFDPVALLTQTPNIAVVHKNLGINNLQEFKDYVKANPGEIMWSHTPGSTDHFFTAMLMKELGLDIEKDIKLIGYEGTGPQVTALIAEQVHAAMFDIPSGKAFFEDGTVIPMGVAYDERLGQLPDVQTMNEQGLNMTHSTSRGLFVPKGTPEDIIVKIEQAFKKALENPEIARKIVEEQGTVVKFIPHTEYKGWLEELQAKLNTLAEGMDLK
jgi:tripartite-type tricarboxylate transporter receptor subunit TctC